MSILTGLKNAQRALRLIKSHPRLIPWALIPAMVTFTVSILGVWLAIAYGDDLLGRLWPEPEEGVLHWVWIAAMSLIKVTSTLLTLFITPWLVILLGIPLCEPLATRADAILGGEDAEVSLLKGLGSSIGTAISVTAVGLGGSLLFFVLGLIPVVGFFVGPFVLFVWTPLIICFDLQDSPLSRRDISLRKKVNLLRSRPMESIFKGLVFMGLLAIPIVNLLGLPIAVIGGVMAVRDLELAGELNGHGTPAQL